MSTLHSSHIPVVFQATIMAVLVGLLVHPRFSTFIIPGLRQRTLDKIASQIAGQNSINPKTIWQMRDFYSFHGAYPPAVTIPDSAILDRFPQLLTASYFQTVSYQSRSFSSIDVIPSSLAHTYALAESLGIDWKHDVKATTFKDSLGTWVISLHSPFEAVQANGFYYENKHLMGKYWISIAVYYN